MGSSWFLWISGIMAQPYPTLGPFLAIIDQWQKKGTGAAEKAASQRPEGLQTAESGRLLRPNKLDDGMFGRIS